MAAASAAFLCCCERKYRGVKAGGRRRKEKGKECEGRWTRMGMGGEEREKMEQENGERRGRRRRRRGEEETREKKKKTVQGRRQLSLSHWVACHPQRSGSSSEPPPRLVRGKMGMYKGLALDAAWVKPPPGQGGAASCPLYFLRSDFSSSIGLLHPGYCTLTPAHLVNEHPPTHRSHNLCTKE